MILKTHIIEGHFRPIPKSEDFELELVLRKSALKIKGLSKKLLIEKQSELEKEHAIYILEGPLTCYVGKSTDVQSRINNHKDKNKSDFSRCFVLSQKDNDLREYLDYMESYTIREMESLGYVLANTKKPDPNDDILPKYKKEMANDWVDEFLSFLPILGFRKSPSPIAVINASITKNNNKNIIELKFNGNLIQGENSRERFNKLLQSIGLSIIEKKCASIFDTAFSVSTVYAKPKYGSCRELKEDNKNYFVYANISKNDLIKKIIKIKEILQLNIEIID